MPHILISNDDGIFAAGLRALVDGLQGLGKVSIVAPSQERSGAAQSLTLRQPIFFEQVAENEWSVDGTPTDSMIVALHRLFPPPRRPDLVISGINGGANMGENVFYSGTVGAAMEAAINRVPSIAISVAHRGAGIVYEPAARFARRLAEVAIAEGIPEGVLLNVNVPSKWNGGGVRFTRQSKKITRTVLQQGTDPRGRQYYWLNEEQIVDGMEPGSDYEAVASGDISITPLELDRTHDSSLKQLSNWAKLLETPRTAS
jgi:5'-nucleotidase